MAIFAASGKFTSLTGAQPELQSALEPGLAE
jgi:hypothetical protein